MSEPKLELHKDHPHRNAGGPGPGTEHRPGCPEDAKTCVCGHPSSDHLHDVGPCRMGANGVLWGCSLGCMEFLPK